MPSWQSDAVKGYLNAVTGTSKQPYTSVNSTFSSLGYGLRIYVVSNKLT